MNRTSGRALVWLLVALFVGGPAVADEFNYHTPLIGERAVGMGGAATAVADDASASFYNPAGLAQTRMTSLSLSATVVQFRQQDIDNFLGQSGIDQWSLDVIAASWSWATDLWGGRFALSLYVPQQLDMELDEQIEPVRGEGTLIGAHLIRRVTAQDLMGGATMAWALHEKWALGFTLFGSYQTFSQLFDDTFLFEDGSLIQMVDNQSGGRVGTRLHLGILYQPIPELQLGLSARLGFHFLEWNDWRRLRLEPDPSQPGSYIRDWESEHQGVGWIKDEDARDEIELKDVQGFALGVAWQITPDFLLASDVSLWSSVKFKRLGRVVEKEPTVNVAIGGEYRVFPEWPMRFGLFTNFSAAPDVDKDALADLVVAETTRLDLPPDQIDHFGVSISLGHLTSNSTLDVALVAMVGYGDHVEMLETGAGVHGLLDWQLNLTISGSYIFEDDSEAEEKRGEEASKQQEEELRRQIRDEPTPWENGQDKATPSPAPPGENEWRPEDGSETSKNTEPSSRVGTEWEPVGADEGNQEAE